MREHDSEETIIAIVKQGGAGLATADVCRQHGITEQTYHRWKAKCGGMDSGEAKKLKQLEEENRTEARDGRAHLDNWDLERRSFKKLVEPVGLRATPCGSAR